MVNLNPFSAFFGSGDPPGSLPVYSPLPDEPAQTVDSPVIRRRPIKEAVLIASGLLLVGLLIAVIGQNGVVFYAKLEGSSSSEPPEMVCPASRGVSAGVSEKANRQFVGQNISPFPWNHSMLMWQRTAFHFQPQENWMNGNFLFPLPSRI